MKVSKGLKSERVAVLKRVVSRKRALDSTEKTTLHKAVKDVKQILKSKEATKKIIKKKDTKAKEEEEPVIPVKNKKRIKPTRGIIYLGHIPHGFFEEQMIEYFSQFGKVTKARVARSKKTGNSRGYGYVQFLHDDVAKVAAKTMNNYLMCGRLLKATHIPPEKHHFGFFARPNWTKESYPTLINRNKATASINSTISEEQHAKHVKKTINRLKALESKLSEHGINLKFKPVDE